MLFSWIAFLFFSVSFSSAQNTPPYVKNKIGEARFGSAERQADLQKAKNLANQIGTTLIGQERPARALEARLLQYVQEFGMNRREPLALHLIGMPGTGKTAMLKALEEIGFNVVRIQAEEYAADNWSDQLHENLESKFRAAERQAGKGPVILAIEEIDKLRELSPASQGRTEISRPLIGGYLNPLLDEGRHSHQDLSNVLVITTMNLPAEELEEFSKEILGEQKNFFDFTLEDFAKFDHWLRSRSQSIPRILSRMFRPNTVSRLSQNTQMMEPLSEGVFKKIIEGQIRKTITAWNAGGRRLNVEADPSLVEYLYRHTVTPALGARATVQSVRLLVGQLIAAGEKLRDDVNPQDSRALPRNLKISAQNDSVTVEVTPVQRVGKIGVPLKSLSITVQLPPGSTAFSIPAEALEFTAPPAPTDTEERPTRITKKALRENRFPELSKEYRGVADAINEVIFGQEEAAQRLEEELTSFASKDVKGPYRSNFLVLAGFPGIGKSALVRAASEYTDLPIARVNLQGFSSDDPETGEKLKDAIISGIMSALDGGEHQRCILALEELDKIFEISPQTGEFQNRPALNILKDILDGGLGNEYYNRILAQTFVVITMNFGVDRFGFKPDPRITSFEDVLRAWKTLSANPTDRKKVLSSLFLPETVNRIFDKTIIVKPLDESAYERVIEKTIDAYLAERLIAGTTVKLTRAYREFLKRESVVPSEGARNTEAVVRRTLSRDLEAALRGLSKIESLRSEHLVIELDFSESKEVVRSKARTAGKKAQVLSEEPVALTFPPLEHRRGGMKRERVETGVHEFGHAFAQVLLGGRMRWATVISFERGIGGAVFPTPSAFNAEASIRGIYVALASRAMERLILDENPEAPEARNRLPAGSTQDLLMATESLFHLLHTLGANPYGPTMERMGVDGVTRYANFADLPPEQVEALGMVLRGMEDEIFQIFSKAQSREWYLEKITEFSRAGGMNEETFRMLVGAPRVSPHIEGAAEDLGIIPRTTQIFGSDVEKVEHSVEKARAHKGADGQTSAERWVGARTHFEGLLKKWLKPPRGACDRALT